jgi:superfamily I DNA/RNA helicase
MADAAAAAGATRFSPRFLLNEWDDVVDAWQLESWEAYRDVRRLGRKTRLSEPQRKILWSVFAKVATRLHAGGLITHAALFTRLASAMPVRAQPPYDFVVIDESQDISVAELRFLAALGATRPNALFFAGDLGQRIFQTPFSWKSLGVDIRGRSRTLHINYRTSHQIRMQADRLLGPEVSDVDGNAEERKGTISTFNGPPPTMRVCDNNAAECEVVSGWLVDQIKHSVTPHEIAVMIRSEAEIPRATAALDAAHVPWVVLDERLQMRTGRASVCTMHLAKGLEFRSVAVMACDDEIIPLQNRIESVTDDADLEEVYSTERHLLYVACTRARDCLLVTATSPASEFLGDLDPK